MLRKQAKHHISTRGVTARKAVKINTLGNRFTAAFRKILRYGKSMAQMTSLYGPSTPKVAGI